MPQKKNLILSAERLRRAIRILARLVRTNSSILHHQNKFSFHAGLF
jgi:hypothetical protein